ncbi:DUF397 domain-containing protein [Streptomyces sedi]|uniref:DUF397 domain-containing protein n=1 Tax=Streptomyces sedi TaxID=555059 RepID=A0A5C4V2S4_9ACTN|nr:DUF397 domain-containing protein [Streptomyces sedi]TNM29379.1 DUF397 domain-containing protein [Streptomyces sedi]
MRHIPDASGLTGWRKSSFTNNGAGDCVEVTYTLDTVVPVRDSKRPTGPAVVHSRAAWAALVEHVKK